MMSPTRKTHPLLSPINSSLIDLPAPTNLTLMWNFGSLLGLCLMIQITTGLLLTMHYSPHIDLAFNSISHITREVNNGWMLRNIHANSASMFFMCMYAHMARGLYYKSFHMKETWNVGTTILLLSMATAFMGYLLPWGQMSFWGATVITNLFSAIPYIGKSMVEWLWGGFGVSNPTLTRFFALHYALPFIIAATALIHIILIHQNGSNNPMGISSNMSKTPFHPLFTVKDIMGFTSLMLMLSILSFFMPFLLGDPENFIPANPLVTPTHIKPEWYFLWAYAILRSIPNKLGGVIMMFSAILLLYTLPLTKQSNSSSSFNKMNQTIFWLMALSLFMLTWLGAQPVEPPYETLGMLFTTTYFLTFMFLLFL